MGQEHVALATTVEVALVWRRFASCPRSGSCPRAFVRELVGVQLSSPRRGTIRRLRRGRLAGGGDHRVAKLGGEFVGIEPVAQLEHPLRALCLGRRYGEAVSQQEGAHGGQGDALVAVDERLGFSYALGKHGGLERQVGPAIVGVLERTRQGALERRPAPELIGSLLGRAAAYLGICSEDILAVEIEVE